MAIVIISHDEMRDFLDKAGPHKHFDLVFGHLTFGVDQNGREFAFLQEGDAGSCALIVDSMGSSPNED